MRGKAFSRPRVHYFHYQLIVTVLLVAVSVTAIFAWQASRIATKAYLSQWLLQASWQHRVALGQRARPWPGLDNYPVARLFTAANSRGSVVLNSASGQALAFAPSLINLHASAGNRNTTSSNSSGNNRLIAIAGHRNTHLAFLEHISTGDFLGLESMEGNTQGYRVHMRYIVDTSREELLVDKSMQGLLLITCYPFDTLQSNGPLRLVVYAAPEPESDKTETDGLRKKTKAAKPTAVSL